jgi:hypothetical protein
MKLKGSLEKSIYCKAIVPLLLVGIPRKNCLLLHLFILRQVFLWSLVSSGSMGSMTTFSAFHPFALIDKSKGLSV